MFLFVFDTYLPSGIHIISYTSKYWNTCRPSTLPGEWISSSSL